MICPECGAYNMNTDKKCFNCKLVLHNDRETGSQQSSTPFAKPKSRTQYRISFSKKPLEDQPFYLQPVFWLLLFTLFGLVVLPAVAAAPFAHIMMLLGAGGVTICMVSVVVHSGQKKAMKRGLANAGAFFLVAFSAGVGMSLYQNGTYLLDSGETLVLQSENIPLAYVSPEILGKYDWAPAAEELTAVKGETFESAEVQVNKGIVFLNLTLKPSQAGAASQLPELIENMICKINDTMVAQDEDIAKAIKGVSYGGLFDEYDLVVRVAPFGASLQDKDKLLISQTVPKGSHKRIVLIDNDTQSEVSRTPQEAGLGKPIVTDSFRLVVNSVSLLEGGAAYQPKDGYVLLEVVMELDSLSDQEYVINTAEMFKTTVDDMLIRHSSAARVLSNYQVLDGTLEPWGTSEGSMIFEIPNGWSKLLIDGVLVPGEELSIIINNQMRATS